MDDIESKIAALKHEIDELSTTIDSLGKRLGAGEDAVRLELNPAIRRQRELESELRDLERATGRRTRDEPQVMYGPPWRG